MENYCSRVELIPCDMQATQPGTEIDAKFQAPIPEVRTKPPLQDQERCLRGEKAPARPRPPRCGPAQPRTHRLPHSSGGPWPVPAGLLCTRLCQERSPIFSNVSVGLERHRPEKTEKKKQHRFHWDLPVKSACDKML